jgi:hypothetical protein
MCCAPGRPARTGGLSAAGGLGDAVVDGDLVEQQAEWFFGHQHKITMQARRRTRPFEQAGRAAQPPPIGASTSPA